MTASASPTTAATSPLDEHLAYVREALEITEEWFYKTDEVDWEPIREWAFEIVEENPTKEGAHDAVGFALGALATPHTAFISPGTTEGSQTSRRDPPSGGRFENVAYLLLPGTTTSDEARDYAERIRQIQQDLEGVGPVCGWILDLRESIGGSSVGDWLGLGPLVGDELLMRFGKRGGTVQSVFYEDGTIRYEGPAGESVLPERLQSDVYLPESVTVPIAVLVSARTASAGEAVAITFVGRPDTQSFGERTAGATTSSDVYQMPDGGIVRVATGLYQDRTGRTYEDGLEPDVSVPTVRDSRDHILDAAREWLNGTQSCQGSTD